MINQSVFSFYKIKLHIFKKENKISSLFYHLYVFLTLIRNTTKHGCILYTNEMLLISNVIFLQKLSLFYINSYCADSKPASYLKIFTQKKRAELSKKQMYMSCVKQFHSNEHNSKLFTIITKKKRSVRSTNLPPSFFTT